MCDTLVVLFLILNFYLSIANLEVFPEKSVFRAISPSALQNLF